jgi:cytidylate kinase
MAVLEPYVITISRQLGTGGTFVGRRVAERLGIFFAGREILAEVARTLETDEKLLEGRDERVTPMWESLLQNMSFASPELSYVPPALRVPSDREVVTVQARVIDQLAASRAAVIVGRGGVHVLRGRSRHLSVLLHASHSSRRRRVEDLYRLKAADARGLLEDSDSTRARFHRAFSGKDWLDARQYHLSLDTGIMGLDVVAQLVEAAARARFEGE